MKGEQNSKSDRELSSFLLQLKPVYNYERERKRLMTDDFQYSSYSKNKILRYLRNKTTKLEVYSPFRKRNLQIYSLNENYDPLDICSALQPNGYLSHYSAIFLLELTNQVPREFMISHEINKRKKIHTAEYNDFLIEQVFMKTKTRTSDYVIHKDTKYFFIEKTDTGKLGVIYSKEKGVFYTNLERTLLDIVEAPHYSGGITTVMAAWENARDLLDLARLRDYYNKQNYFYPYWQTIGFLIEECIGEKESEIWKSYFGAPVHEFYIDRGFKMDWLQSQKWNLRYPKGIF